MESQNDKKIEIARKFCQEVKELAQKYDLPFFVVTDGASATSNNRCIAVKNARENHIKWEKENGIDPYDDWIKKTNTKINEIMNLMDSIEYGFKDENGKNIINTNPQKWDNEFDKFYYLQTADELLKSKCGVCWDQVELERKLFQDNDIKFKTYFIYIVDNDMLPSHTFLTYEIANKYYWFEHSWEIYKGIHEYENELELLLDIKEKFKKEHNYC